MPGRPLCRIGRSVEQSPSSGLGGIPAGACLARQSVAELGRRPRDRDPFRRVAGLDVRIVGLELVVEIARKGCARISISAARGLGGSKLRDLGDGAVGVLEGTAPQRDPQAARATRARGALAAGRSARPRPTGPRAYRACRSSRGRRGATSPGRCARRPCRVARQGMLVPVSEQRRHRLIGNCTQGSRLSSTAWQASMKIQVAEVELFASTPRSTRSASGLLMPVNLVMAVRRRFRSSGPAAISPRARMAAGSAPSPSA